MKTISGKEAYSLVNSIVLESQRLECYALEVGYYHGQISLIAELHPLRLAEALFNLGITPEQAEYRRVEYNKQGHPTERLVVQIRYNPYKKEEN